MIDKSRGAKAGWTERRLDEPGRQEIRKLTGGIALGQMSATPLRAIDPSNALFDHGGLLRLGGEYTPKELGTGEA